MNLVYLLFTILSSIACFRLIFHVFSEHRKWLAPILILPVIVIAFCFVHWRTSRAYVFFFLLTLFTSALAASLSGYDLDERTLMQALNIGLWPLALIKWLISS
jgi:hypothetical protein